MFYYISGRLAYLDMTCAVVDAGGVGYKMTLSQTTFGKLPHRTGAEAPPQVTL